jgi:hypothetical protein
MKPTLAIALLILALPAWGQLPNPAMREALPQLRDHEWGQLCATMADWPGGAYGDFGQHDLTLYLMGDKPRARRALDKFKPLLAAPSDRNTSREFGLMVPCFYGWLKAEMTDAERTDWEAGLHAWAKMIVGYHQWGPETRLDDSDVLLSHYTTLKAIDKQLVATYCDLEPAKAMREQFKRIMLLARGGVLPESSEYNIGTTQLLILGCAAVGLDEYPEVRDWLPELAAQMQWEVLPDLSQGVQWGDVQKPRSLEPYARIPLMLQVCGLGGDKDGRLLQLAATLLQKQKTGDLYHNLYRAMWCFDPRTLPATPRYEAPTGLRVTRDHVIYRDRETLWHVFAAAPTGMDHGMSQPECRLWHKGRWILDSPRAYQPWPTNQNASLAFGLEPMADRGLRSAELIDGGAKVVLETKGPRYLPPYWDAPPSFVDRWQTTLTLQPGSLRGNVLFEGSEPTRLDRYYAHERAAIESSPALQQLWHTPPGSTPKLIDGGFSWLCGDVPLTLTSNRAGRAERVAIGTNIGSYVEPSEEGGWLIRFEHDELPADIESVLRWDQPEPPDVEVLGVIRTVNGKRELVIPLP